jgi:hypothetical protein
MDQSDQKVPQKIPPSMSQLMNEFPKVSSRDDATISCTKFRWCFARAIFCVAIQALRRSESIAFQM